MITKNRVILIIIVLVPLLTVLVANMLTETKPKIDMPEQDALVVSPGTWKTMLKHTLITGTQHEVYDTTVYVKGYDVGKKVPKYRTLPYDFRVCFTVLPSPHPENCVVIQLNYRIEMGHGYVGHVILYMKDLNFDMQPDIIERRTCRSFRNRFFIGGPMEKRTPIIDSKLPIDMNEWDHWLAFFLKKFEKVGAFNKVTNAQGV
jgi:hypothetical protein